MYIYIYIYIHNISIHEGGAMTRNIDASKNDEVIGGGDTATAWAPSCIMG